MKSKIKRVREEPEYVSLETAQEDLLKKMEDILCTMGDRQIHLLKAQTALGKTYAYCDLIKKYHKDFKIMVVVPTNKLQYEVARELQYKGIEVYLTPNTKDTLSKLGMDALACEVENLYETGCGIIVKSEIAKAKNNCNNPIIKARLEEYLKFKEVMVTKNVVVTTHAMFLHLPEKIIREFKIIVDEDILSTVFKNMNSISFYELIDTIEGNFLSLQMNQRIEQLMRMDEGTVTSTEMGELYESQIKKFHESGVNLSSGILNFVQSTTCYIDVVNENIHYFTKQELPNVGMMIVSATMCKELYENYAPSRVVTYDEVALVKLKGQIFQYTKETMSRSMIDDYGYEKMYPQILKHIKKESGINTLTFKKYTSPKVQIYLGKCEGFNDYKGEDLLVIGTPHNVPFVYKLVGKILGYDTGDTLAVRNIIHNGYEFNIMTYGSKGMRDLQLFFIESELEQAVGRARALRYLLLTS